MSQARPVIVTGCSSGIGLAIARGLDPRRYRVFATARAGHDVRRLREQGLESCRLDLTDSASIHAAFDEVMERTGNSLYALVNNGAYGQPGAVEDLDRETLRLQFETNVFGTHELTRLCIPVMRQSQQGRIIQISSILGRICLANRGAYNASKYALEALSDTLRLELTGSGIEVSLVEPGPITSRFRDNALAAFRSRINAASSVHGAIYRGVLERLQSERPAPFTLPPEAVVAVVRHALDSRRPRIRYPVTTPARVLPNIKRFLTDRAMDRLLRRSGDKPARQ